MNPKQPKRSIDERLDDIDAQLKNIRQLLNYVLVELGSSEEEARAFEAGIQQQTLEFAAWSKDEEAKGRPKKELTFDNFVKDSADGEGNGEQR
jgi:hypothetical protein